MLFTSSEIFVTYFRYFPFDRQSNVSFLFLSRELKFENHRSPDESDTLRARCGRTKCVLLTKEMLFSMAFVYPVLRYNVVAPFLQKVQENGCDRCISLFTGGCFKTTVTVSIDFSGILVSK